MTKPLSAHEFSRLMEIFSCPPNTHIAVGVSGGADSLCLIFLLHDWVCANGGTLTALTVDHQLRENSTAEAQQVQQWLVQKNIRHHILTWVHKKKICGLQATARKARYQLMEEWCLHNQATYLATAHHADDQQETLLQRLAKGSGLKGLCCITPKVQRPFGTLIRPLLTVSKRDLEATLHEKGHTYITDPSNQNTQFDRVRWREMAPKLHDLGLTHHSITKTIRRLQIANTTLDDLTDQCLHQRATLSSLGYATFNTNHSKGIHWADVHTEIRHRCLIRLLLCIGNRDYAPPYEVIDHLDQKLLSRYFTGHTAGGCHIFWHQKKIFITKESRQPSQEQSFHFGQIWDDRFHIFWDNTAPNNATLDKQILRQTPPQLPFTIASLGKKRSEQYASILMHHPALLAPLPVLSDKGREIIFFPHFPQHFSPPVLNRIPVKVVFFPKQRLTPFHINDTMPC